MTQMDIKGLDYNTQRNKLVLPEYGREIQKMVDYALTLTNPEERQKCAEAIIAIMMRVAPQPATGEEATHKYWDHLAVMSDFKLDIEYPFDINQAHSMSEKPQPLKYPKGFNPVRHYGAMLFETFKKLENMPAGEERDRLVEMTANHMKHCLMEFGHGSADNEKVAGDLAHFTNGKIQLDLDTFKFANVAAPRQQQEKKKKRK